MRRRNKRLAETLWQNNENPWMCQLQLHQKGSMRARVIVLAKFLGEVSAGNWISCGFSSALTERSACNSGGDVNMKCQVADEAAVI